MIVRDVLIAARALIERPEKWSVGRGMSARDASGEKCDPQSPTAVSWCGYGAVFAVLSTEHIDSGEYLVAIRLLDAACPTKAFCYWQDTVAHPVMLAAFDRAIAAATAEGTPS
jgi:hypothetical protein